MDSIDQHFRVDFRYPVHFTRGAFRPDNSLLAELIGSAREDRAADLVVVLDDGVAEASRDVHARIEAYIRSRPDVMRLAAPILTIPGGEQSKNDPRHLDAIHRTIHDARLCRHSYVV